MAARERREMSNAHFLGILPVVTGLIFSIARVGNRDVSNVFVAILTSKM